MTSLTAIDRGIGAELASALASAAFTLAKRFAAGATMWSIAPSGEPHARHIAVEFVHPVIMGKRALPAVALTGPNPVDLARLAVRPGDIVVAVSGADQPDVRAVMRRCPAWGATTVWIGSGERPRTGTQAGPADHMLWLDDTDPRVSATGGFVLLYHLLWELTHVCFEHSGLVRPDGGDTARDDEGCVTCSDEGRLGEVVSTSVDGLAAVRTARGVETVMTTPVDPVAAGELVLVHAGTAISRVGDDDAGQGYPADEPEPTDFLYPFLAARKDDAQSLLAGLARSAQEKATESLALQRATLEANAAPLQRAAAEMAHRFAAGGRMFTFGNGGSCTDAATLADLFARPPIGEPLPAWSLTADPAILTALGNDVGFELVYARQLIARAQADDIAIAMSTSGASPNLLAALAEAHQRGLYTIGFAGYDGGAFADNPDVDTCLAVGSQSVHRIQESQALLGYRLWMSVHERGARSQGAP